VDYVEIDEARTLAGLRLVLTPGVPGPWGESAKSIFHVKKLPFVPVRQPSEEEDRTAFIEWTRQTSAPVAMYEEERPRSGWSEILFLAERLAPEPSLVPTDARERALMFGFCHEICAEQGLAWTRRLQMLPPRPDAPRETMAWKYGVGEQSAGDRASARLHEILALFHDQLLLQRASGQEFLLGERLSALDIYWACFSNMLVPLPPEQSPMADWFRPIYTAPEELRPHPDLIEHRDRIFERYLALPQDF
jgi:glutathione S-transferase